TPVNPEHEGSKGRELRKAGELEGAAQVRGVERINHIGPGPGPKQDRMHAPDGGNCVLKIESAFLFSSERLRGSAGKRLVDNNNRPRSRVTGVFILLLDAQKQVIGALS